MRYPTIEAIADLKRIEQSFTEVGHSASVHHWSETARELARHDSKTIDDHAAIYNGIIKSDGRLSSKQIFMFVDRLLGFIPDEDGRKRLVQPQATLK